MWNANTTMGEGGFMNESKSEDAGKSNVKRGQNIVPLMIGHLLKASEHVDVWGIPAKMITIVGVVKKIEPTTTKITYEVQDETGTISACQWLEAEKRDQEKNIQLNTYVEINGLLRAQDGQNYVMILKIFPLTNLNQLTTHLLEVTWFILKAKKLYTNAGSEENLHNPNIKRENPYNSSMGEGRGSDTMVGFDTNSGMKPDEATVLKIIQSAHNIEVGIERDQIKAKVPAYLRPGVDRILDFLSEEGHIYTTESENHFKAT